MTPPFSGSPTPVRSEDDSIATIFPVVPRWKVSLSRIPPGKSSFRTSKDGGLEGELPSITSERRETDQRTRVRATATTPWRFVSATLT